MNVLEVECLSKKFENTEVIKDVSFSVKEGETLVILGPSGSGKSTLLRCINNLERVDGGNIIINKKEMIKEYKNNKPIYNNKEILNQINLDTGMVFQDFNLFPHLSVKENITISLINVFKMSKEEADKKANEVLKKMDLKEKENCYPCDLSGGQKQRVSIARVLAINPKIICMDEPTSALDPELVGEVLKTIKALAKEKRTMIIVTHEIKFAEEVADRVIFMDGGIIVEEGKPEEVIKKPKKQRTKEFLKRYINLEDNSMKELDIEENKPREVISFFKEISDIPRESGNEKKIRDYLVKFAKERSLEYYTDNNFNVIIRKPASSGYENEEILGFQSHTDMICEKIESSMHDFSKDPIKLYQDGDFILANGTTLGADNGIGVAYMLAILDSDKIKGPELECIFTTQEETTMIGAKEIDGKQIKCKKIISLDNGKQGKMVISSANCLEWFGEIEIDKTNLPDDENFVKYELVYSNFLGGHSGGNIGDIKRGNPIKLGIEVISKIDEMYIESLEGGSRVNVIPRNFRISFYAKENDYEKMKEKINKQIRFFGEDGKIELNKFYTQIDKANKIENCYENSTKRKFEKIEVFSKFTTRKVINFVNRFVNGPVEYDENNNVILSANMGAVKMLENAVRFEYSLRSNDIILRNLYLENLKEIEKTNNINITWEQELKGIEPNYNSSLVEKCAKIYKEIFNVDIEVKISQGVLEGGFFNDKIKGLEYICIGADTYDVHSPKERVSIKSIGEVWDYIKQIISIK
ncbi:MAG: beta-Ala-His dipeptidase [Clostridia bacterium]|nr:beta-Ala-His dipeptidase [Clostridia bacterium]